MKSFRICMQNIRKWGSNSRIKMCLIMSFLLFIRIFPECGKLYLLLVRR